MRQHANVTVCDNNVTIMLGKSAWWGWIPSIRLTVTTLAKPCGSAHHLHHLHAKLGFLPPDIPSPYNKRKILMRIWFLALTNIQPRGARGSILVTRGQGLRQQQASHSRHILLLERVICTEDLIWRMSKECRRRWPVVTWGLPAWNIPSPTPFYRWNLNLIFSSCCIDFQKLWPACIESFDCERIQGHHVQNNHNPEVGRKKEPNEGSDVGQTSLRGTLHTHP